MMVVEVVSRGVGSWLAKKAAITDLAKGVPSEVVEHRLQIKVSAFLSLQVHCVDTFSTLTPPPGARYSF